MVEKECILENLLNALGDITNLSYQKRIWILGEGPEVDSFDDAVNDYFQWGDIVVADPEMFGLTELQRQSLRIFHQSFDHFADDNNDPELFIDTPEWKEIMEMARKVLDAFGWKKGR